MKMVNRGSTDSDSHPDSASSLVSVSSIVHQSRLSAHQDIVDALGVCLCIS